MNKQLREHADQIIREAIAAVQPDAAVQRALAGRSFPGRVLLVSAGKAAWQMAKAASDCLGDRIEKGVVVTKYDHVMGPIANFDCFEAGHPVPDENSVLAGEAALKLTADLREDDTVLFLLSGGGSALFEKPLIPLAQLQDITNQLLACGADIVEINTIRKRLSALKGGKFAAHCAPARVEAVILSDILGDPLDSIASGPVSSDTATCADALTIAAKYGLHISPEAEACLHVETPKELSNVHAQVVGSVRELCHAAGEACERLGYETVFLTDRLDCEAREAGRFLSAVLRSHASEGKKLAFLSGGETVVHLTGKGLGGRNQELALAASEGLRGLRNACVICVGSDGTDGPTDAAGGYVDGDTFDELEEKGISLHETLRNNDAYHALRAVDGLIVTGPTGTNVNDLYLGLIDAEQEERTWRCM